MKPALALLALALSLPAAANVAPKEEFATADAVVKALYDVISGPAGKKRDWNRMRGLFGPEARMTAIGKTAKGEVRKRVFTIEEYVAANAKFMEERGFFEREVARRSETFGNLVQVWSTYEARQKVDDPKPMMRGINGLQLWNDGTRWWILSVVWQSEDPTTPLPERYLKDGE